MDSESFYLIYFDYDNTFIVINSNDVFGKVKKNQVKMKWDDTWYNGLIVYHGDETKCYQKSKKLCPNSTDLRSSSDESDFETVKQKKRDLSKNEEALNNEFSKLKRLQNVHRSPETPNSQISKRHSFSRSSPTYSENRSSPSSPSSRSTPSIERPYQYATSSISISKQTPSVAQPHSSQFNNRLDTPSARTLSFNEPAEDNGGSISDSSIRTNQTVIHNKSTNVSSQNAELFQNVKKIQSDLEIAIRLLNELQQNFNRTRNDEETWLEEVLYDGKNLLEIEENALNKYVITVMETLFTKDELKNGLIKTEGSRSKREKLDDSKIELMKQAVKNKFRVPNRRMGHTWRQVLQIAKRCCYDSIKKK